MSTITGLLARYDIPLRSDTWWRAHVCRPLRRPVSPQTLRSVQGALRGDLDLSSELVWLNFRYEAYDLARRSAASSPAHDLMIQLTRVVQVTLRDRGLTARWEHSGGPKGSARLVWRDQALLDSLIPAEEPFDDPTDYLGPHDDLGAAYHRELYGFYPDGYVS